MTQERMKWTMKVIGKSIRYYQRKLTYQLELEVEKMFHNGLCDCNDIGDVDSNIKTYETIIADLATIRRAISKGESCASIYSFEGENLTSLQVYDVLVNRAKLHIEDSDGKISFVAEEDYKAS